MPDADDTDTTEVQTDQSADQEPDDNAEPDEPADHADDSEPDADADGQIYPAAYVRKLRRENQGYRDRAKAAETRAEDLSRQLFRVRVEATGKLADPDDLPYDADLLADDDKLNTAVDDLIAKRPHYAKRKVAGSVGQGVTGSREEPFSLLGRLKQSV